LTAHLTVTGRKEGASRAVDIRHLDDRRCNHRDEMATPDDPYDDFRMKVFAIP
jgi:hypothetical protein